ncbi:hypothetical protein CVT24_009190 [Panaeolus cyanescens]|uniref:Hyaluronan/mRNA-binding protein domain-containing protein n=1 Tax=Panaeolus cyanescens TaxID=181874 RepID=A0A409Y8A6_9AGAR|nr:hypothetical protein CVT24_009190 [Panaeolus cyanescens]
MTRTARASYPRAVVKDRSANRQGLDVHHMRKDGGGQHNWGKLTDEADFEAAAINDNEPVAQDEMSTVNRKESRSVSPPSKPQMSRSTSNLSGEDLEKARKYRKHALKPGNIDLAEIARTSAAAVSPPSEMSLNRRFGSSENIGSNA